MDEMKIVILAFLPILFLILNRWRGSRMDQIIGIDLPIIHNGAPIAAIGLMGVMYLLTYNLLLAFAAGLAYFIGEAPGWAKWIKAVPFWGNKQWQENYNKNEAPRGTGKSIGIHQLASVFVNELKDFEAYSKVCLVLRGIVWWAPVYAVFVYFGLVNIATAVLAVILMGMMFPITYRIGWKITKDSAYVPRAEQLYGFTQGIILALSLYF